MLLYLYIIYSIIYAFVILYYITLTCVINYYIAIRQVPIVYLIYFSHNTSTGIKYIKIVPIIKVKEYVIIMFRNLLNDIILQYTYI